jgi:putative nucleotidyltransferase with HDIG domain
MAVVPQKLEVEVEIDSDDLIVGEDLVSLDPAELNLIVTLGADLLEHALEELPAPSAFPERAARALSRREFEFDELVKLAHTDVAIAAGLLRAANSAFYTSVAPLDDLRDAVGRLGTLTASQIVSAVAAQSLFDVQTRAQHEVFPNLFRGLFRESMTSALVSSRLAERTRLARAELAFAGALFHDIGKVVAMQSLAGMVMCGQAPRELSENVIHRVIEDVHVRVGVALLRRWTLPEGLVSLCAHHHDGVVADGSDGGVLHAVRLVSGLNALRLDARRNGTRIPEVQDSAKALGVGQQKLEILRGELARTADQVGALF